jgi:hypothetical protein
MTQEMRIDRGKALLYGGAGLAGLTAGAAGAVAVAVAVNPKTSAHEGDTIVAPLVGAAPATDPESSAWGEAQRVIVPIAPQQVAPPFLDRAVVTEMTVSALHDGRTVALKLEWDDPGVNDLDGVRRYHDAVAIQLPTKAGDTAPAITMGAPGAPVHILQWRATWERDLTGRTGVDQIYPRVEHDVMPDDVLPPETARLYWVGRAAGNPLSQVERTTPIEEIVAEGFGTVTHLADQRAVGRGVHDGERWQVAIGFPAERGNVGAPLTPGSSWPVAFAIWRGDSQNRGGRKHYATWLTLQLEGQQT